MNFYSPLTGLTDTVPITYRPKTCFLLTQLGGKPAAEASRIHIAIKKGLDAEGISWTDAASVVTGKDYLLKIWKMIFSVPLVIAVVQRDMPALTRLNIFYELGVAQAMGKETVVVVGKDTEVPSDLVRSEYIPFDGRFKSKFKQFLSGYSDLADHYETIADQFDRNPVLAIDYLRRSFLISGQDYIQQKAQDIVSEENFAARAKNSVELLLARF